jgi:hypothetical protein
VRKEERDGFATWRRGRRRGKDERKRGCLTERVGWSMTMRVMVFIFLWWFKAGKMVGDGAVDRR